LHEIARIADSSVRLQIAPSAIAQMDASRAVVRRAAEDHLPIYGINTGFGKLCEVRIPDDELARLQLNLVRSHACGLGAPLSEAETRVIVALRANTLALGYSGVRPVVAQTLALLLNRGVYPVVPSKGSVGASGDLAPLAHLALCVIGEGEAIYGGERMSGRAALDRAGIEPVRLQAKEGWAAAQGHAVVVVLSTELTDELILEGLARELVRTIQDRRKEMGCQFTDRITVDVGKAYRKLERTQMMVDVAKEALTLRQEGDRISGNQLKACLTSDAKNAEAAAATRSAEADELQARLSYELALAEIARITGWAGR